MGECWGERGASEGLPGEGGDVEGDGEEERKETEGNGSLVGTVILEWYTKKLG